MPTVEAQNQEHQAVHRNIAIHADNSGQLPTRIELVRAGEWPDDSNKGHLEITRGDLLEMKLNFDTGVGITRGLNKLAIDFMHESWAEAALWIGSVEVEGDILYGGDIEYTTKGREALLGGMFKCFSPSFYPRCLGSWHDPEDWSISATNVLVGGALTNIPFFKNLTPIMASRNSQEGKGEDTLFVEADAKGAPMLTLDEVRVLDASALTEEHKALLKEHETELSADEKIKFGFTKPVEKKVEMTDDQKKDAQILADIRDGKKVLVDASEHEQLKAKVEANNEQLKAMHAKEVKASVAELVKEGKIKSDTAEKWETRVLADATVLDELKALPANPLLASEIGADNGSGNATSAIEEVKTKATELVKAAKEENRQLPMYEAQTQVLKADSDLEKRYNEEMRGEA